MDNILFEFESEIDKKNLDTILNYISEYHLKNVINIKKINLLKNIALLLLLLCITFNIYFFIYTKFNISSLVLVIVLLIVLKLYLWLKNPIKFIKFNLKILNKISFQTNKSKFIITNSNVQRTAYLKSTYGKFTNITSKYNLTDLKKVLILNKTIILSFKNNIYIFFNFSKNNNKYNDLIKFIKNHETNSKK